MGRWQERFKSQNLPNCEPSKPSKPKFKEDNLCFVGFVGARFEEFQSLDDILLKTAFTSEMIQEGQKLWEQPFDKFDLDDISRGKLTVDQIVAYLQLWEKQHPEYFKYLVETFS